MKSNTVFQCDVQKDRPFTLPDVQILLNKSFLERLSTFKSPHQGQIVREFQPSPGR